MPLPMYKTSEYPPAICPLQFIAMSCNFYSTVRIPHYSCIIVHCELLAIHLKNQMDYYDGRELGVCVCLSKLARITNSRHVATLFIVLPPAEYLPLHSHHQAAGQCHCRTHLRSLLLLSSVYWGPLPFLSTLYIEDIPQIIWTDILVISQFFGWVTSP